MILVVGVPLLIVQFGGRTKLPPRTVEDQEFTRQANATCERILVPLRRERPERPDNRELRNEALVAGRIDRAADGLAELTADLRRLPVAANDQADVAGWLDDWDAYVGVGRRYAEALRRQDANSYRSITDESTALGKEIFLFAQANDLRDCTP